MKTLDIDPSTISIDAASFKNLAASVSKTVSGHSIIEFDEYLDFWLFSCCHLTTIMACKPLDGEEYRDALIVFKLNLDMRHDPSVHKEVSTRDKAFAVRHMDCMELTHALSRAMIIFLMCHEYAHIHLRHLETEFVPLHELDADRYAAELLLKIVDAGTKAGDIFVSPKLTCAPLLLFRFLEMYEVYRSSPRDQQSISRPQFDHPPAFERYQSIYPALKDRVVGKSKYILYNFELALTDAAGLLNIEGYGNGSL